VALSRLFVLVSRSSSHAATARVVATTAKEWLATAPRGAYTTARTVGRDRVLLFSTHIERLASSAASMGALNEELGPPPAEITDPAALHLLVEQQVGAGLDCFFAQPAAAQVLQRQAEAVAAGASDAGAGDAPEKATNGLEARITVLLSWGALAGEGGAGGAGDGAFECFTHIAALPPRNPPPVHAVARRAARHNATAKDSQWIAQRKALARPEGAEEVLLIMDEVEGEGATAAGSGGEGAGEGTCAAGVVLEGTQTNFFAAMGGKLYTAEDGVLSGTVRRMVLHECTDNGIEVVRSPPRLADAHKWDGAFICSTSRLVMPLDSILLPSEVTGLAEDTHIAWDTTCELVQRVEAMVASHVDENATPIVRASDAPAQ